MDGTLAYQSKYNNSWALVIGINEYQRVSPLDYATNDAEAVAALLIERFGFPKDNVHLLLNQDATAQAIRQRFFEFTDNSRIQPDDRILVFFAGHGHTISGKRGEVGFLIPWDGNTANLPTLMRWDEFTRNADLIPAKHIFFLMDACYGGLALTRSPAFGSMRFLGDMLKRYSRQVLTAGKADETVADGNGVRPGHSIFTAHLLNALEGAASTKDGIVTASGVMAYVYDRVAQDHYSRQTPHYGFFDGDGDFIFDTSLLDTIRKGAKESGGVTEERQAGEGEEDILINTSPQISSIVAPFETSVVEQMKELLSDPAKKIRLDDYVSLHIRRFLEVTDLRHFPVQDANVQKEDVVDRVARYEEAASDLQQIVVLLAKWGDSEQLQLLERIFQRLAEADKGSSGVVLWLRLSWYPILLLIYSAGIAALASRRYDALRIALQTRVQSDIGGNNGWRAVIVPTVSHLSDIHDAFKWLPGHERHYVPRSEHLFKVLQPTLEDLLLLGRSYESLFDEFEILLALAFSDVTDRNWGPPGRFGWKHDGFHGESPFNQLVEDAKKEGAKWGPIRGGLFNGSSERFAEVAEKYRELLNKLNWW